MHCCRTRIDINYIIIINEICGKASYLFFLMLIFISREEKGSGMLFGRA